MAGLLTGLRNLVRSLVVRRALWQHLLAGVILIFLGSSLYQHWRELRQYQWTLDYRFLALSFLLLFIAFCFRVSLWQEALRLLDATVSFQKAFEIWFLGNLGRYIPGRVWQFLGWIHLCGKEGINQVQAAASIAIGQVLTNTAGLLVAFLLLARVSDTIGRMAPLLVAIPASVVILQPSWLEWAINYLLRNLGREPIVVHLKAPDMLRLFGLHFIAWVLDGLSFYTFASAVYQLSLAQLPIFIAIFAGAYVAGYLSLITPGGLGVREGVLTYLLSFYLPWEMAIIVSLLSRVWLTAFELGCAGFALTARKRRLAREPL